MANHRFGPDFFDFAGNGNHFNWIYRDIENPWTKWFWDKFQANGPYGVYLFFVVSGFLITHIIAEDKGGLFKPDYRKFYARRAGRILPLYLAIIALGAGIYFFSNDGSWRIKRFYLPGPGFDTWFWASLATFSFNWLTFFRRPPALFYGQHWLVLWSLAIEEQFYFLYPFVLRKIGNTRRLVYFLLGVVLTAFLWRLFSFLYAPTYLEWPLCNSFGVFDLIALGILLYLAVRRLKTFLSDNRKISWALCLAGLASMAVVYSATSYGSNFDRIYASSTLGIGLFVFLLGGLHLPFFESGWLRAIALPGKYCYGLYLIHSTLFCFIEPYFLERFNTFVAFAILAVIGTAVAAASFHWFELPANKFIRKLFGT